MVTLGVVSSCDVEDDRFTIGVEMLISGVENVPLCVESAVTLGDVVSGCRVVDVTRGGKMCDVSIRGRVDDVSIGFRVDDVAFGCMVDEVAISGRVSDDVAARSETNGDA